MENPRPKNADAAIPPRFLIPVEGLIVPQIWSVGRIVFHPGHLARSLVDENSPLESRDDFVRTTVLEILDGAAGSSIAEVSVDGDIEDAVDAVRASLDALRLFLFSRRFTETLGFGLPGDVHRAVIRYVLVGERSTIGGRAYGWPPGYGFTVEEYDAWRGSTAFQFLSEALADPSANEGARRASVGAQLLSRACLEHRPDLKLLGIMSALEAWVLRREAGTQTMRLVRHVSWFGCGSHSNDLCGRDRPICPYLRLKPDDKRDRDRLKILRDLGDMHLEWRCSEWHQVMDWYAARSGSAHGDPTAVDERQAARAEFWVTHYLVEPILNWLRSHADDPVGDLVTEVNAVEEPSRWQEMLTALDSPSPPAVPPL